MVGDPAYQQTVFGWLLRHPGEAALYADRLKEAQWVDPVAKECWDVVYPAFAEQAAWPTKPEALQMIAQAKHLDPTMDLIQNWLAACYDIETTSVTAEAIKEWVVKQDLMRCHLKLSTILSTPLQETEALEEVRYSLESVQMMVAGGTEGKSFRPLDEGYIDDCDKNIEEGYGGKPIPTGIYRLDRKLRDGGVRAHNVLIQGPTGAGKTSLLVNIIAYNLTLGHRIAAYFFDDSEGDIVERLYSFMLRRQFSLEAEKVNGTLEATKQELLRLRREVYFGDFIGIALDPEQYTPADIARDLAQLQRQCYAEDRRDAALYNIPEELWGKFDAIAIDTANQVIRGKQVRGDWLDEEKKHQALGGIPKRYGCPLFMTVQSGQGGVGATQLTDRNVGLSYGVTRPAKLILGFAQTYDQYHSDKTINQADALVQANKAHLRNWDPVGDKDTKWKPWWLCISKNSRGRDAPGVGAANKVKLPMLINYGSCRVLEDFTRCEEIMLVDKQTQREEREAAGALTPGPKPPRMTKRAIGGKLSGQTD